MVFKLDSRCIFISYKSPFYLAKKAILWYNKSKKLIKENILNSKERNFLRKRAHNLEAVVRIGKEGVTDSVLESISAYIKKNELMKIKLLQNSLEDVNNEIIEQIESSSNSIFIGSVGKTMIFFKEKIENGKPGEITQEFYDFKKSRRVNNAR